MDLYQLEYFLEAARQRSFTRAAERLHLAQAALSEQMRKLEAELGTPLFDRGKRETTLTAAGETLRGHAEVLLAHAEAARRAVLDVVQLKGGRVVVAAIPSVNSGVISPALRELRRHHPAVDVVVLEGTSESVAQWVEEGRAEIGVVQQPTAKGVFEETLLFEEPFVALLWKSHELARRRRVKLAALADETLIFSRGRARDAALTACREAGFEPRIACEHGELETVRALVAAGLGIAILPELATRVPHPKCAVLRLVDGPIRRKVAMLRRPGVSLSPGAAFLEEMLLRPGNARTRGDKA